MLNIDEFTKRLEHLFDIYELTPSTFADKIGVQRSSISHLLSGRNKPSLDFVLKVQDVFPDVELNWLLHGKGSFNSTSSPSLPNEPTLFTKVSDETKTASNEIETKKESQTLENSKILRSDIDLGNELLEESKSSSIPEDLLGSQIDKIVIFYKNGTFKSFKPD